jgi:hypothetical protein
MGRKRSAGLRLRQGIWHIEKQIDGRKLCESTGTRRLEEAELILARRRDELRQASVFGVRPRRMFRESATRYLEENTHLASIEDSALHLRQLDPFIGALTLDRVHSGTLQPFIEQRRRAGLKVKSINNALGLVRRILNLSARLWRDEHGLTWLENAPLIQLLPDSTARESYVGLGRAAAVVSGTAGSSDPDVSVQGQHGMSRTGSVRIALGMGSASAGVEELGVYHPRRARQEPRGSVGGSESGCTIGDRRGSGQAPGLRLHLPRPPGAEHQQHRLAMRAALCRLDAGCTT